MRTALNTKQKDAIADVAHPHQLTDYALPVGITSIGIELEGYWATTDRRIYRSYYEGGNHNYPTPDEWMEARTATVGNHANAREESCPPEFKTDGSIHSIRHHHSGEVAAPVPGFTTWSALQKFIREYYPTKVDGFCGMHVHLGCNHNQLTYAYNPTFWKRLNDRLLQTATQQRTKEWLTGRIEDGRSTASAHTYATPLQMPSRTEAWKNAGRYGAINYHAAFRTHRTMEIRVLPMAATTLNHERAAIEAIHLVHTLAVITGDWWTNPRWQEVTSAAAVIETESFTLPKNIREGEPYRSRFTLGTRPAISVVHISQPDPHSYDEHCDCDSCLDHEYDYGCPCDPCTEIRLEDEDNAAFSAMQPESEEE